MATQNEIEQVGERIERAYYLRRARCRWNGSMQGAWSVAASKLLQLHRDDPTIPVDPELFVAAQHIDERRDNPWVDLTQEESARRYRRHVRKIVRGLRAELHDEVRRAERRVRRGEELDEVLTSKGRSLSPLGRFIVAHRAGRDDMAERFQAEAEDQHWSCPLYRQASLPWLSSRTYPVKDTSADPGATSHVWLAMVDAPLN